MNESDREVALNTLRHLAMFGQSEYVRFEAAMELLRQTGITTPNISKGED